MKTAQTQRCRKAHAGHAKQLTGIAADVIACSGGLGDEEYPALEIQLPEFNSPYVLRLALPVIVYRALAEQIDPLLLYEAIACAINGERTTPLRGSERRPTDQGTTVIANAGQRPPSTREPWPA